MKKLLLVLLALVPLAGCASSGPSYFAGGTPYFYGDCLYLEDCYDGYYRYQYFNEYPVVPVSPAERLRVEKLARRGQARTIGPRDSGGSGGSSSSSAASSAGSSAAAAVVPRAVPVPVMSSAPAPPPPVSHAPAAH